MTVQVLNFNTSKTVLRDALRATPEKVRFYEPSPFGDRHYTGADLKVGSKIYVVMDHPKRLRFAIVIHSPRVGFRVM